MNFMMQKLVKAVFVALCALLGVSLSSQEKKYKSPIHIQYAKELTNTLIPLIERDFDLSCCGDGGAMADRISEVSLRFSTPRRATIQEARELEVRCIQRVLDAFNHCEKIRPYLAEYPFTAKNVDVMISFETNYGPYSDETVYFLFQAKNKLYYYKHDPIKYDSAVLFEEPYPEALKIVQNSGLPDSAFRTHAKKPYEDALDAFFMSFIREAHNKWGLVCMSPGGDMKDGIKRFDFSFLSKKKTTVEQARKLMVGLTEMLVAKINKDEKLRPYLDTYPFPVDQTQIYLRFQKSDTEDFEDGSLYCVTRTKDNNVRYERRDIYVEGKAFNCALFLMKEETYDESLQIFHPPKK